LNAHQSTATTSTSTTTEEPFHGSVIGVVGGQALSIDGCSCRIGVDYCPEFSEGADCLGGFRTGAEQLVDCGPDPAALDPADE
jgi:hypothetical protein